MVPNVELVIFDCDGVLVDSEPVANRTFASLLREQGLELTQEQMFDNFVGFSLRHCLQVAQQMLGRTLPANFLETLQERTFSAFRDELKAIPGIEVALDRIDVPYCVASSGDHRKMRTTLGLTGLLPRFEGKMYSVTQVALGKPAPDVYLFAAEQMHATPQRCVVIEDTPPGVTGAVAAGMTVFGYCAHTPVGKLVRAGAHRTFDDMRKLLQLLRPG